MKGPWFFEGLGLRVWGFRILNSGFRVRGLGFGGGGGGGGGVGC